MEEDFPRGGTLIRSKPKTFIKRKAEDNLFPRKKKAFLNKPHQERKTREKTEELTPEDNWLTLLKLNGTLSYEKIQEGLLVLGCINKITPIELHLELPGSVFAKVSLQHISEKLSLSTDDEISLNDLFQVGQVLPTRIIAIDKNEKGLIFYASIHPRDINNGKSHLTIKKGMTVWGSIVSESDHGYEISIGVANSRVFLPHKFVEENHSYQSGQVLYMLVKSITSDEAATLTVSTKRSHLNQIQPIESFGLNDLLPGMKVKFTPEEVTKTGVKGTLLDDIVGYIDATHLFDTKLNEIQEDIEIDVRILYVEDLTKIVYLTLKDVNVIKEPKYQIGTVRTVLINKIQPSGLRVKLDDNNYGFICNRRLMSCLKDKPTKKLADLIKKKFSKKSKHKARILYYSYLEEIYTCTIEPHLVKEKYYNITDVKIGEKHQVIVREINSGGLVVTLGHIRGFVPNTQISNTEYTEKIKQKFTIDKKVDARVWNIVDDSVIFTLKSSLIESDVCLSKLEDVQINSQVIGVITATRPKAATVTFYGELRGFLNKVEWSMKKIAVPLDEYFFVGQVIKPWVVGIHDDVLHLSMMSVEDRSKMELPIGRQFNAVVSDVFAEYLQVLVKNHDQKVVGKLPIAHLSGSSNIAEFLQKKSKVGTIFKNLLCVGNLKENILSRREKQSILFDQLKIGMVLRSSYEEQTNSGIKLSLPIKDLQQFAFVPFHEISGNVANFKPQQCILVKILQIDSDKKFLKLTCKSENVFDDNINVTIEYLSRILEDYYWLESSNEYKLTKYRIGQKVDCLINKKMPKGYLGTVNKTKAFIPNRLVENEISLNSEFDGTVLAHNFSKNCLYLTDKKFENNGSEGVKIDCRINSICMVDLLLKTDDFFIGQIINKQYNQQLVYLPVRLHENDYEGLKSYYKEKKFEAVLIAKTADKLIALPKRLMIKFNQGQYEFNETNKFKQFQNNLSTNGIEEINKKNDCMETKKKRKNENNTEIVEKNDQKKKKEDKLEKINAENDQNKKKQRKNEVISTDNTPILPGMDSFYQLNPEKSESSSEDEDEDQTKTKKKKKLTPAERAELAKLEEERITKIEKELADPTTLPQTADQFDRLLLANPNSSELWCKYIALHVSTTELDKARAVGKRALETINMTLLEEKFNVWIALLNLENMYGTPESFDKLFDDAIKYNEPLDIYLSVINLLASAGKNNEMDEKIKKIKMKEKQNPKMWLEIGRIYYTLGNFKEARNWKQTSLRSITDKKQQFNLIVQFGILEFKYGEIDQAIANFETILETYPKKINIWTIYIDQLVKANRIDNAREVLERVVSQKFPMKLLKRLFNKFLKFEEEHGTSKTIENVRKRAMNLLKNGF